MAISITAITHSNGIPVTNGILPKGQKILVATSTNAFQLGLNLGISLYLKRETGDQFSTVTTTGVTNNYGNGTLELTVPNVNSGAYLWVSNARGDVSTKIGFAIGTGTAPKEEKPKGEDNFFSSLWKMITKPFQDAQDTAKYATIAIVVIAIGWALFMMVGVAKTTNKLTTTENVKTLANSKAAERAVEGGKLALMKGA